LPTAQREALFDLPSIEAALRAEGMSFDKDVLPSGNVHYAMQIAGVKFGLIGYGVEGNTARSMELRTGFTDGGKVSRPQKLDICNKWNSDKRYVKAYVDGDDTMLEMDLLAVGAVEPKKMVRTISDVWMFSVMQFATTAR
jgi:hypothetical protein